MALNTLPNAGLTNRGYPSDRLVTPIIINGDMSVAQRGTSFSFSSSSGFTVDRFDFERTSGATGDCTITQESDAPSNTGLVKSVKIAVDTAETPTGGGNCLFQQKLEGFNVAPLEHGQSNPPSATLSFWVKSNKTGTYSVQVKAEGSTGRYVLFDYTISSANTWEKKIITWVGDTSVALDYDSSRRLRVIWHLASGPNDKVSPTSSWATSSIFQMSSNAVNFFDDASNEIYFTGVQLEVGEFDSTSIPAFPFESFANNLNRCMRYCQKNPQTSSGGDYKVTASGFADGASLALCSINPFSVEMRTVPSLTSSGSFRIHKSGGASSVSGVTIDSDTSGSTSFTIRCTTSSLTSGQGVFLEQSNDSDAHIILDAEL
jgi:hypothetical protein